MTTNHYPYPLVFLDTETCGLGLDDPIWEIALVRREDSLGVQEVHHLFVQHDTDQADKLPERFRRDHARRYNRAEAWDPVHVAAILRYLLRPGRRGDKARIVGANPQFDTARLEHQLALKGLWDYHLVDIGSVVTGWIIGTGELPPDKTHTDALADAIGVTLPHPKRHTALGDVELVCAMWDHVHKASPYPGTPPAAGAES